MEDLRKQKLREAIIEQRKRFCFFIMHFSHTIKWELEMHELVSFFFFLLKIEE